MFDKELQKRIDAESKKKAYALFERLFTGEIETGTANGLKAVHFYLFDGLYDFAGKTRRVNIAKGGFMFASAEFLDGTLRDVERMPERSLEEIVRKYVEMNVAHPFMEGNGRSMRIWLDMMLRFRLGECTDWAKIEKSDYFEAMRRSVVDDAMILSLVRGALTDRAEDEEVYRRGVDASYFYEAVEGPAGPDGT